MLFSLPVERTNWIMFPTSPLLKADWLSRVMENSQQKNLDINVICRQYSLMPDRQGITNDTVAQRIARVPINELTWSSLVEKIHGFLAATKWKTGCYLCTDFLMFLPLSEQGSLQFYTCLELNFRSEHNCRRKQRRRRIGD